MESFNLEPGQLQEILTIQELNERVRLLLEGEIPPLWIEGEISNFSSPGSGHWYFSLKDSKAQVRCAMFRGRNQRTKLIPENGLHVLLHGQVSLYEPRGDYQFLVDYLEPLKDGALQQAFNLLKEKLFLEGLFEQVHKKALPLLPHCLGVITSPTGAAIQDILRVLRQRFPSLPVIIYPTLVQGESAPAQICQALQLAIDRQECDILMIARGGGSLEDLWAFNDETLARAIFACPVPVITGIGHEIDFTIADFVADERAPTPSAAAMRVAPDREELSATLAHFKQRLVHSLKNVIADKTQRLGQLSHRLIHPQQRLRTLMQAVDHLEQRLISSMTHALQSSQQKLYALGRALNAVSPLATLDRGYSITMDKQHWVINSIKKVSSGQQIHTKLKDGEFLSQVMKITVSSTDA